METINVEGTLRVKGETPSSKDLRKEGLVPCVVYGNGQETVHFYTAAPNLKSIVYTPAFSQVSISVDGKEILCVLKDMQFNPVTDALMHADFQQLVPGKAIKVEIPVKLVGNSDGVKVGGKMMQKLRRIKVKTTPEFLLSTLELDVTTLKLGESIRVRDIKVEEGVEIMVAPGTPVATVEIPRALRSAASAEAKEA